MRGSSSAKRCIRLYEQPQLHTPVNDKARHSNTCWTIVDNTSTALQQEQLIERFEDVNGGLMDGADHGPPCRQHSKCETNILSRRKTVSARVPNSTRLET